MATDKSALLPGQTATFANYTSYYLGINGVMIDVAGLTGVPTADDFQFRVGNDGDPANWPAAPAPSGIAIRDGAGVDGSDRITIIWPDRAIEGQWLQVRMLATADTSLSEADVFYFGNAVGEAGDTPNAALVDGTDFALARDNPHNFLNRAPVDFPYDYNRDSFVDGFDLAVARDNGTNFLTALKLITAPDDSPAPPGGFGLLRPSLLDIAARSDDAADEVKVQRRFAAVDEVMARELAPVDAARALLNHDELESLEALLQDLATRGRIADKG